ncbi:MAG TPA: YiaA/YiaB family inner membrane protein [Xanthobacteraceae bacterium]|jgi:hypothetical protein
MNPTNQTHSGAWVAFNYANMVMALAMTIGGVFFLPIDIWIKGYMLMGIVMLVSSSISVTKTIRDVQESGRLISKIEDAKTEQLLMRMDRSAA